MKALATDPLKNLLHLFFPHVCNGCGTDTISNDQLLCLSCFAKLPHTNFTDQQNNPVEQKFYGQLPIKAAVSGYYFTKDSLIQNLVYQLKYKGNKEIGFYLGSLVGEMLKDSTRFNSIDALVPLPLNPKRQKKRGYNQATAISKGLAKTLDKPIYDNAIFRNINTETQTQRGRLTRWENMQGVFEVKKPELLTGKHLVLVDDVITTGASLIACGSALLQVPNTSLSIVTLAYTI